MWMTLLGLIPGLSSLVSLIVTKVFDAKVQITQARIGGDRDVAIQLVRAAAAREHEDTTKLSIFASNKFLTVLLIAFAIPLVWFEWKVIVYDTILGYGTTEVVKGQVADWGNTIIYFLFGAPTVMGLAKMWFTRKTS